MIDLGVNIFWIQISEVFELLEFVRSGCGHTLFLNEVDSSSSSFFEVISVFLFFVSTFLDTAGSGVVKNEEIRLEKPEKKPGGSGGSTTVGFKFFVLTMNGFDSDKPGASTLRKMSAISVSEHRYGFQSKE